MVPTEKTGANDNIVQISISCQLPLLGKNKKSSTKFFVAGFHGIGMHGMTRYHLDTSPALSIATVVSTVLILIKAP